MASPQQQWVGQDSSSSLLWRAFHDGSCDPTPCQAGASTVLQLHPAPPPPHSSSPSTASCPFWADGMPVNSSHPKLPKNSPLEMLWPDRSASSGIIFPTIAFWEASPWEWQWGREGTVEHGAALSCSSWLKAEREIKDREKEIKEDERQKGKKIGTGVSHLPIG